MLIHTCCEEISVFACQWWLQYCSLLGCGSPPKFIWLYEWVPSQSLTFSLSPSTSWGRGSWKPSRTWFFPNQSSYYYLITTSQEITIPVFILCFVQDTSLLHRLCVYFHLAFLHQLKDFSMSRHLSHKFLAVVLHQEIILVITLEKLYEFELFHPHKIFLLETELIFQIRVKFIEIWDLPFILISGWI